MEDIEELKGQKMDIVMSLVHNNDEKIEILRKEKIKTGAL